MRLGHRSGGMLQNWVRLAILKREQRLTHLASALALIQLLQRGADRLCRHHFRNHQLLVCREDFGRMWQGSNTSSGLLYVSLHPLWGLL